MKTRHYLAALAALMIITVTSCGNVGAQNDKNKKSVEDKYAIELTSDQFSQLVYDIDGKEMRYLGDKPAIVDFTATWCGPCRSIAPILEELAKEHQGHIVVYKVDVDRCREVAEAFGITSIPAVLYIPLEGEPSMTIGARNKSKFQNEIERILLDK
jgi:thioredoxin